jgi:hypothetical protein
VSCVDKCQGPGLQRGCAEAWGCCWGQWQQQQTGVSCTDECQSPWLQCRCAVGLRLFCVLSRLEPCWSHDHCYCYMVQNIPEHPPLRANMHGSWGARVIERLGIDIIVITPIVLLTGFAKLLDAQCRSNKTPTMSLLTPTCESNMIPACESNMTPTVQAT